MKRGLLVICLSSLCAIQALATTYVRVEPDGSKTYSDRPLPGGHEVELQQAQTYSTPPAQPIGGAATNLPREQQEIQQIDNFRYTACALTPKNDDTFQNPESVNVGVSLSPSLRVSDVVDLKIDGASVGSPGSTTFSIPQPVRGAHSASVTVKDRFGKILCTASSTFHVFRASVNSPARR